MYKILGMAGVLVLFAFPILLVVMAFVTSARAERERREQQREEERYVENVRRNPHRAIR
ncbi:hypothetical protein [uncultured Phenylobacterium sp.]|uniref:hypothetical protein n=1 Tax=uncultured Phenylobacterium sp. TaxID=349273 RepID=UPI0025FA2738|nr:hypothetical protein [uncultured Phenylobacterium sp.]